MCVFGNIFNMICNTFASFTAWSGRPTMANELVDRVPCPSTS